MSMTLFLCSSPTTPGTDCYVLDLRNHFIDELKISLPEKIRLLFVASSPDEYEKTGMYADGVRQAFETAGFCVEKMTLLDRRNAGKTEILLKEHNTVFLAGGHVPTQNAFFADIDLKGKLSGYNGVIIGCSAGTMNMAEVVYCPPEEPGEASDPDFSRFLPGLGLTRLQVFPHWQYERTLVIDGLRNVEDIALPDSVGHTFYALTDGSYILSRNGKEEIRGEAYRIHNGYITQISAEGETVLPEG